MEEITIIIDTREKLPLRFPEYIRVGKRKRVRVHTVSRRLEVGDYALVEAPTACIVERKGSNFELEQNAKDGRLDKQLRRLRQAATVPVLLCETIPRDEQVLQSLLHAAIRHQVSIMAQPSRSLSCRKKAGLLVAHLLWRAARDYRPDPESPQGVRE